MRSLQLIKLIRATDESKLDPYSYEYEFHSLYGKSEHGFIKDNIKSKVYGKSLKMTGNNNHAVKYLNTWNWVVVSESEYKYLLSLWSSEE